MKKQTKYFLLFHILAVCSIPLFYLFRFTVNRIPKPFAGCFLHDRLFLYCPLCGGTRAVDSLLHFRVLEALKENAFVVLVALLILGFDISAWVRFIQKKAPLVKVPNWLWIALAAILAIFFVLRNLLLIAVGFDPLGDLLPIWRAIKG